ncbi:MAG: NAD(P)H-dependent oxidoreductase [Planctomycetota bacterium]
MSRILAFSGSARRESYNQKLVRVAARGAAAAGADVTVIDLADFPMPIFDEDLERREGMPEAAARFKQLLLEHDALLIASPEYNSAFSPLLKNAIDWASRATSKDEPPLSAYRGKTAAILAASPGGLGGMRGLVFLRLLLSNIGITVIPDQIAVARAHEAFDAAGEMTDEKQRSSVEGIGARLHAVARSLGS